jgi:hypothetical protein
VRALRQASHGIATVCGVSAAPSPVIDYVREANERLREQLPAGQEALAEKKQALVDVKARLARYHERFERAGNAGEEDFAWKRIKELHEQETSLKAEIAGLEAQQISNSDRELDAVRARRYLRTLAHFFRSRPRYEESLYEALHRHHGFRVAVLAKDLVEATLEFEGEIEPSEEDDSTSRRHASIPHPLGILGFGFPPMGPRKPAEAPLRVRLRAGDQSPALALLAWDSQIRPRAPERPRQPAGAPAAAGRVPDDVRGGEGCPSSKPRLIRSGV